MRIGTRKKRKVSIVEVSGRLTLDEGEEVLRDTLRRLLDGGERRFVFNLNGLSVIDSAGVGEIVECYKQALDGGAVLKVALRPDGLVRHVFEHTGLDRALEIFDEEEDAVASYR